MSGSTISWSSTVAGGVTPYTLLWSGTNIAGATSTNPRAVYSAGTYTATLTATDASTTVATATCSATVASTTPTPPLPQFFKSPQLNINPSGHFLARGMKVTSVASTTITGTIWGTTWTIHFTPNAGDEAYERGGKALKQFNLSSVKVGDEIAVSGKIDPSAVLTVDAKVIRNYSLNPSIFKERGGDRDENKDNKSKNKSKNKNKGNESGDN